MSSPEIGLVTAIVDEELAGEYAIRVRPQWFFEPDARRAWGIITSHWETYHESISRRALLEQLPGFDFDEWDTDPEALLNIVEDRYINNRYFSIVEQAGDMDDENARKLLTKTIADLRNLQQQVTVDEHSDAAESMHGAVERYHYRKEHKDEVGLPFPWAPLQRTTYGAKNGNYIVLFARKKNGKTWTLLYILLNWYYTNRRRVLLITREMTVEELQDRLICMMGGVDYLRFYGGELNDAEEQAIEDAADAFHEMSHFYIETIYGSGREAVAEIDALCDKHGLVEGDVVAVDGMYFFVSEGEWLRGFSQGVKTLALRRKLVALCSNQANREMVMKLESDAGKEMGMGDAPVQDADMVIKQKLDHAENQLLMMLTDARNGVPCMWTIQFKPATDFSLKFSDAPDQDREAPKVSEKLQNATIVGTNRKTLRDRPKLGKKKTKPTITFGKKKGKKK